MGTLARNGLTLLVESNIAAKDFLTATFQNEKGLYGPNRLPQYFELKQIFFFGWYKMIF